MIPKDTVLGTLHLQKVFIDYDGPQLFSCEDENGRTLLAVHAPLTQEGDNWLYVYITHDRLLDVEMGEITLRDAFFQPEDGTIRQVTFDGDVPQVATVEPQELPPEWFPEPGARLGDDDEEEQLGALDLLTEANNLKSNSEWSVPEIVYSPLHDLPDSARDRVPMWEMDPQFIEYLRNRRTPVFVAATRSGRSVIDIIFPRNDMPVAVLGNLLVSTQAAVESLVPNGVGSRALKLARETAQLDALPFFPGSFGIRLDSHKATLLEQPELAVALNRLISIFDSASQKEALRTLFIEFGKMAAIKIRNLAKAIESSGTGFVFEVGIPHEREARETKVSRQRIVRLLEFLDKEIVSTSSTVNIRGRLIGVSLRSKHFVIESSSDIISGRISDEFLESMNGKTIGDEYDALIAVIIDVNETTRQERTRYVLKHLSDVPPLPESDEESSLF